MAIMNREQKRSYIKKLNSPEKMERYIATMENNIRKEYSEAFRKEYEKKFQEELSGSIDTFILTIIYTLHFNNITSLNNEQIADFMEDLLTTVNMFNTGEYNPDDYRQELKDEGITLINCKGEKV